MDEEAGVHSRNGCRAAPRAARILLVEDDALVRNHVAAQLERLGYAVTALDCAPKALSLMRDDGDFDLVLSDIRMPGELNGTDLARELRALYPDLPILLTSGFPDSDGIPRDLRRVGFLAKPYRRQALADKVCAMLCGSESADA